MRSGEAGYDDELADGAARRRAGQFPTPQRKDVLWRHSNEYVHTERTPRSLIDSERPRV
jgi:hypothetical protein